MHSEQPPRCNAFAFATTTDGSNLRTFLGLTDDASASEFESLPADAYLSLDADLIRSQVRISNGSALGGHERDEKRMVSEIRCGSGDSNPHGLATASPSRFDLSRSHEVSLSISARE
jgi:hypothetical protein